jgi:nitrite reductase/ring-hydroxylating ferredoxin subunit
MSSPIEQPDSAESTKICGLCTRRTLLQVLGAVSIGIAASCVSSGAPAPDGGDGNPQDLDGGSDNADDGGAVDDDGGAADDGGMAAEDGGSAADGGSVHADGGNAADGGSHADGGAHTDGGSTMDGGPHDAGTDAGTGPNCMTNFCLDTTTTTYASLRNVNGSVAVRAPNGDRLMVVRTGSTAVVALSDICTHQGCNMSYSSSAQVLNCPCHGAQFALDGSVVRGPAVDPVRVYSAQLVGSIVVISMN